MKALPLRYMSTIIAMAIVAVLMAPAGVGAVDVNAFTIRNYEIDHYLAKDSEGRSTLKTVEKITANFPASDVNHGIERAIPATYDGHHSSLNIISVTGANGIPYTVNTYDSNDNTVVRIGDADTFVHGITTYVLTYTQRDVTKYFADTDRDELYWDTNGTEWRVPIENLTVRFHADGTLTSEVRGAMKCYYGSAGSSNTCEVNQVGGDYTVSAQNVAPGQNITIALGFAPQTFAQYKQSLVEKLQAVWALTQFIVTPIAFVVIGWMIVRMYRVSNRVSERGTIVPEYIPPSNASVSVAGTIAARRNTIFGAQLIDLAVRHYIRIYQTGDKTWFTPAKYELEIQRDIGDLLAEEQEILTDIFPSTAVGTRLDMSTLRSSWHTAQLRLHDNNTKLDALISGSYALRANNPEKMRWFKRTGLVALGVAVLTLSPFMLGAALLALVAAYTLRPLTDEGLVLWRYLEGLKMYITVAEQDRIRMLQAPDTADKLQAALDTTDKRQLVKLYERVLPYAVLFGLEKKWNSQIGQYYQEINDSPDWIIGTHGAYAGTALAGAMSSFSSAASYATASNSAYGGSSGGGSSGGGGGGGGGGGW